MFILVAVTGEISSGAIDVAESGLENLVKQCGSKLHQQNEQSALLEQLVELQQKALGDVLKELIRQITSSNLYVRKNSIKLIRLISELQSKPVSGLIQPYAEVLIETVAPRKHLKLRHYTVQSQIGILEGIEFALSLQPQIFIFNMSNVDHSSLYQELLVLCDGDDNQLTKNISIKNLNELIPLRKAALNTLASFYNFLDQRETILSTLHHALANPNVEIQKSAFQCLKKFISSTEMYSSSVKSQYQAAQAAHTAGNGPAPTPNPALETLKPTMQIAADYLREYLHPLTEYTSLNQNVMQHLSYITQLYPTILNEKFSEYLLIHLRKWFDDIIKIIGQNAAMMMNNNTNSNNNQIKPYANELKLCASIISLLAELQSAPAKLVEPAITIVLKHERVFMLEVSGMFREPLSNFLKRYPFETLNFLLHSERIKDSYWYRFTLYLIKNQPSFAEKFKNESSRLIQMLNESQALLATAANSSSQQTINQIDYVVKSNQTEYLTVLIIYRLVKKDQEWIGSQAQLIDTLVKLWVDEKFHERHRNIDKLDYIFWKEPIYIIKIFLKYHRLNVMQSIELIFKLLIVFQYKSLQQYEFLRLFLKDLSKTYTNEWKRAAFFTFVKIFNEDSYSQKLKANILQHILIPCFQHSFESNQHAELIGGPAQPDIDSDENIISVFINKIIDPDNPNSNSDSLRIFLLQLSSLFVQHAHDYIHDVNNKRQGTKLRRLMTFAWPCLLAKNCVDPFNKYHGHLLLSHIISKFAIHKRIVLQVFISLLKAYAPEAKIVIRQALEILTPSFPTRMEDGYFTLASWTKKILIEENHTIPQLAHMLYIIVKYHKVYYLIRHTLINHLIPSFQKVGLSSNSTPENRQLAIDLTEVILRWEAQRLKEIQIMSEDPTQKQQLEQLLIKHPDMLKPFDKHVGDCILNFFIRISCPLGDQQQQSQQQQQMEQLSKKCLTLFHTAISNDIWPNADIKIEVLERILLTLESTSFLININPNQTPPTQSQITPNFASISVAIEILTFLIENASKTKIQTIFKTIQRGMSLVICCTNSRVVKMIANLVQKLMQLVPIDSFNSNPNAPAETTNQDPIYFLFGQPEGVLCRAIIEGLSFYDKTITTDASNSIEILNNCLLLLKSASANNPQYIDRIMGPFMRILQRLYRDHLNAAGSIITSSVEGSNVILGHNQNAISSYSELLIQSIDLIKFRIGVMSIEMRKMFINSILVTLIEKSNDLRVVRYLVKIVSDWIKYKNGPLLNQIPSLKEKLILLQRLTNVMEKRFVDQADLQQTFLETIAYVYKDDVYSNNNEFKIKLESAFLAGLKSQHPTIRQTFFDLFNANFNSTDLYERLCYIIVTQNWEAFGTHFWIKQCIQMTLGSSSKPDSPISYTDFNSTHFRFLNLTNAPNFQNPIEINVTDMSTNSDTDTSLLNFNTNIADVVSIQPLANVEDNIDYLSYKTKKFLNIYSYKSSLDESEMIETSNRSRNELVECLVNNQLKLFDHCKNVQVADIIFSLCQLCHANNELAHQLWIQLFIQMFNILNTKQQQNLYGELTPFLASGSHCIQKVTQLSTLNTFLESFALAKPVSLFLKPSLLVYLAKNHNLWHRSILILENSLFSDTESSENIHEAFTCLSQLYTSLKEDDYKAGLWYKKAVNQNTKLALIYEQQGLYYQAQKIYEDTIARAVDVYLNEVSNPDEMLEFNLWEERWIKCCKELNQWNELNEYAASKEDLALSLECAWKQQSDWQLMKNLLLSQKDLPKDNAWKWYLYQGYYLVCNPDDYHNLTSAMTPLSINSAIESKVERSTHFAIREWRRLPRLITPAHMTILQAAQQIVELQEAFQIQNNLFALSSTAPTGTNNLQEIKGIIKTWRMRLPLINDDLSYWNDIFTWRQYHYESFSRFYEKQGISNPAMLGVHALAQGIVHFAKIARKQHLYDLCLDTLNKIHKKQSVPIIDCFLKVKQEIKCYINTFEYLNFKQSQESLDVIEATNLRYFTKENVAELISLKAHFLQLCGKYDDANHLYSFSVYLNDAHSRLWGAWGDYLAEAYVDVCKRQSTEFSKRSIEAGESALIALLHAARHSNSEPKARKYISKILYLLTYDNEKRQLHASFDLYSTNIPCSNWINWIPQLITILMQNDDTGKYIINLMNQIVRIYPLALYYPLRTVYLKLRNDEQTEKLKSQLLLQQQKQQQQQGQSTQQSDVEMKEIMKPASEALIRLTTLMHRQREMHPTLFNTLEGLIDQLLWLKVNWYEELLRNFKQTLSSCYAFAFELNKSHLADACIDPFSIIWFKKLHKFYADPYWDKFQLARNLNNQNNQRVRCLLAILNDPNYKLTRQRFLNDFNYQLPSQSVNLLQFVAKLKQWIKLFETHVRSMPKQQLLDERFKFVTQFCSSTAEIEVPGEYLIPRSTNYYVKISRFLPRYESVEKYNSYSRRISIRGHNGKIYPFLISNEATYYECRKEEHVMQLMRMLNTYLFKQKETSSRNLHFHLPRMVSLSSDVRMIEDDCSSVCLLDIYKNRMRKLSALLSTNKKDGSQKLLQMCDIADLPLSRYYEKVQTLDSKLDLFKHISSSLVSKNVLKEWAVYTFSDASDYFTFRKTVTTQLAMYSLAEFAFHLNRLNPDQFYMSQNSGVCQAIRFKFDLNESNGVVNEFNKERPVPFRLTPNLSEFISQYGIFGTFNSVMIGLARCLSQPQYQVKWLLKSILKYEIINSINRKRQEESIKTNSASFISNNEIDNESLINSVNKLVDSMESRLKGNFNLFKFCFSSLSNVHF